MSARFLAEVDAKKIQEEENKIPVINPKLHGPVRSPELVANDSIILAFHRGVERS